MSAPETSATADRVHEVLVVGSGFAGLGQLLALRRAGITDVVLLEKSEALGGTWRDNTYPGCACDIPSHMYSLSTRPESRLVAVLLAPAGDPRVPRAGGRRRGPAPPRALRPGDDRRDVGRAEPHLDGAHPRRTELAGPLPRPRRRGPAPAEDARPARSRVVRRARPSTPRGGTTTSTCAGRRSRSSAPGPAPSSSSRRSPASRRRCSSTSAPRPGSCPRTTSRSRRAAGASSPATRAPTGRTAR